MPSRCGAPYFNSLTIDSFLFRSPTPPTYVLPGETHGWMAFFDTAAVTCPRLNLRPPPLAPRPYTGGVKHMMMFRDTTALLGPGFWRGLSRRSGAVFPCEPKEGRIVLALDVWRHLRYL